VPTRFHLEELKPLAVMAAVATAMEESERQQRRFLELAVHRVKSPLQSILGCVKKVMPGGRATEEQRAESFRHLQEETKDLDRLIVRAARYTRLWREPLTLAEVDLRTLVKAAVEGFESQARQEGVELEVTLPEIPCPVRADHAAIKEALTNLIDNALKFSPAQAAVQIELGTTPDLFKISVTDQGPGFSADQRHLLLEPFASSIPPGGESTGSGLGLPIARTIVERHGGKLDFSQGAGGRGSSFWFTLPISPIDSEA
ncbi:MAG: HAMP domain-containing sensor histidine kinase, partial [Acidobacteriota bacterium]